MERQFCINWPATIEEAKQRRKAQGLTQSRLAKMAGVSTPTISRFENGEKAIQFSTVMKILNVLGMCDQRNLIFPKHNEYDDPSKKSVIFTGQDGDNIIQCAISHEALVDYFDGEGRDPLKVFQSHREKIQHEARRKYLAGSLEKDNSIYLHSNDM